MAQPASTKVGVAYMQNGVAKVAQNLTSDHALAAKAVRLPLGIGGVNASPYFSISDLVKHWPATTARREVFMASDGIDRYYESADLLDPYLDAAVDDAQRAGIVVFDVYTPGLGHFGHSYWLNYWGQIYSRAWLRKPAANRITSALLAPRLALFLTSMTWNIIWTTSIG